MKIQLWCEHTKVMVTLHLYRLYRQAALSCIHAVNVNTASSYLAKVLSSKGIRNNMTSTAASERFIPSLAGVVTAQTY